MTVDERKQQKKPIPPDGGWGWMVMLGFAGSSLISIPILQSFGLLYRDLLQTLEISATDMGIIVNLNSSFGYIIGLMNGPILRMFGYRKVAVVAGIFLACGNFLTSTADSFTTFIIYYGIISSIGFNLSTNAFMLAMNTYFVKNRNMATGMAMTIIGLGPVIVPILISVLVPIYGVRGTSKLLAGMSLHTIVGGLLLHPIKWHYKNEPTDVEENAEKPIENTVMDDTQSVFEAEGALVPRRVSISSDARRTGHGSTSMSGSKISLSVANDVVKPDSSWWSSSRTSLNSIKLNDNAVNNSKETKLNSANKLTKDSAELNTLLRNEIKEEEEVMNSSTNKMNTKNRSCWQIVVKFFDLDLFRDPGYVSITLGLSFAITGEYNFSLMTPFIFGDRGFDLKNTAILMSTIGTADIISRFCSPFLGNWLNWSAKHLYLCALVFLLITRYSLTLVESYKATLIVAICLGIAKGLRTVYMTLVLPNYVPIEKLAAASGLQALVNGLCLLIIGPVIGYVRDATGDFNYCIYVMNFLTLTTIVLWSSELIYTYIKSKTKPPLST